MCQVQSVKCRILLKVYTTKMQRYCIKFFLYSYYFRVIIIRSWVLQENTQRINYGHQCRSRVQPTDWYFFSARPCAAQVMINITYNLHWVAKCVGFQVSLKCTNVDINTIVSINFIPNTDSFVLFSYFYLVHFDNMEHAMGLLGVYHIGEYSNLVRTCQVNRKLNDWY